MKKTGFFGVVFCLLIVISLSLISVVFSSGIVSGLSVKVNADVDTIIPQINQPGIFNLQVSGVEQGNYNFYTLTDVKLLPSSSFPFKDGTNNVVLFVYSTESLNERGYYTFTYIVNKDGEKVHEDKLTAKIVDLADAIEVGSDSNNPDSDKMSFYIKNKENAQLENLKIRFSSILFDFERTISLAPFEQQEIEFDFDKEQIKKIAAGSYIIDVEFKTNKGNEVLEGKVYIGEKKGIISDDDFAGFLINERTIRKTNVGNVQELVIIKLKKDIFSRFFTTFNIEPDLVERDGYMITYTWTRKLNGTEYLVVKAKTNYLVPLVIVIIIGLVGWGFKRYNETKLELIKSVSHVKTKTGDFALKVRLNMKARKDVENVSIIDKIPPVVKIYEKFMNVKPSRIDTANRRIHWDIGNMAAGEERAFSYIIYSKVGVVGKFSLPEALGVFEYKDEVHEVESNKVFFMSEKREEQ